MNNFISSLVTNSKQHNTQNTNNNHSNHNNVNIPSNMKAHTSKARDLIEGEVIVLEKNGPLLRIKEVQHKPVVQLITTTATTVLYEPVNKDTKNVHKSAPMTSLCINGDSEITVVYPKPSFFETIKSLFFRT